MSGRRSPLGRALASLRVDRGWRGRDLAAAAGLSLATVSLVERGRRTVDTATVLRLADALGATVDERSRLAAGWAATGIATGEARYVLLPGTTLGHEAAALLAVHAGGLPAQAWAAVEAAVQDALARAA